MQQNLTFMAVVFALAVFIAIGSVSPVAAQQDWLDAPFNVPHVGVYGRGVANFHWADFPSSRGGVASAACCPGFKNGFGWGWTAGALVRFPISSEASWMQASWAKERFSVALRADWTNHSGRLEAITDTTFVAGSRASQALIKHSMDAQLFSFGGEALLQYRITSSLQVMIGVRAGVFYQKLYTQTRLFDDAANTMNTLNGLRWANGLTRDTVAYNALIPNVSALNLDAAALLGLQWEIPLTFVSRRRDVLLSPEVLYAHPLTSIVPNRGWAHGRLQAGIALKFALLPPEAPSTVPELQSPATPHVTAPLVQSQPQRVQPVQMATARVEAIVRDSTGKSLPAVEIRVEEFVSRRVVPLLVSVFFDEHSATLPERYERLASQDVANFEESSLAHRAPLDVYYDLLNIIGLRMSHKAASTLTLTGCLGEVGMNPASEENDSALALRRAETVRNYLRDTWGIAESRIAIKSRGLPAQPSLSQDALAKELNTDAEENRRVEIESEDWDIIKPVAQDDTLRVASYPEVIFKPSVSLLPPVSWELVVQQGIREGVLEGMRTLGTFKDTGALPDEVRWKITSETAPQSGVRVLGVFTATDATGARATASDSIDVRYLSIQQKRRERRGDKEYSAFQLISFDYANPDPTPRHLQVIDEYVRPVVHDESLVRIIGRTDALGNAAANVRLSQSRAQAVSQLLGKGKRVVQGLGGKDVLHPSNTPEGRFYCRSVEILVETPVK
jgi:outer membrane protein OmpA-like peptidoglycan-associated protein